MRTRVTAGRSALVALRVALVACVAASCPRVGESSWNVLLVTLDTTRADFLSCYGGAPGTTPSIDAVAREGTRFDLAISTAAVTPVSHASILTGLDNAEHGLRVLAAGSGCRLSPDVPTLASVLREKGWSTAAFHSAFPVSSFYGFDRGFEVFDSLEGKLAQGPGGNVTWNLGHLQRRSDETTDRALAWMKDGRRPFFAWIHYWDPHDGLRLPPPEYLPKDLPRTGEGLLELSRDLYAAEVRYMDAQLGRLVDALRKSGAWDRTIVVIVADHGEGLGDHGWQHHRILYQEQIRVPLIVRVPGRTSTPSVADLVRGTDVFPTVLDYLGLAAPRPVSGKSLRALIEGRPDAPRVAFADQINGYDLNATMVESRPLDDFLYCAMDARWKLVYRPAHPEASELYDLADDRGERRNRYGERRDQVVRLEGELAREKSWVIAPFPATGGAGLAAAQQALGGLGYAGGGGDPGARTAWAWTCPEHGDWIVEQRASCPRCSSAPILIRRP